VSTHLLCSFCTPWAFLAFLLISSSCCNWRQGLRRLVFFQAVFSCLA
jgi:hypothetical protein